MNKGVSRCTCAYRTLFKHSYVLQKFEIYQVISGIMDLFFLSFLIDLSENEEGEEEGVAYENLRPTYTHEALSKLVELGHLKHIISQNGDGLHGLSGQFEL